MKSLALCASVSFYKHCIEIAEYIEGLGFKVILPTGAQRMRETGDFSVESSKTWYKNPNDFHIKADLMMEHFENIKETDAILVVNDKKHEVDGYIGPNVIMEMGIAFYLDKKIFVLNAIDESMPTYEEVMGVLPTFLHGNLERLQS